MTARISVIDAAGARKLRMSRSAARATAPARAFAWSAPTSTALRRQLTLEHRGRDAIVRLPLVGEFQIENALVSAGLAIGTGSEPKAVFAALELLEGAKGRLERVAERNGAPIFVDYAHKPDALAKALQALRPYAKRKLVVVFGAGGDRDAGKRPLMGAIAAENADSVIVTDDNPRSENPAAIRAAILATATGAREIGDRAEAIRTAICGAAAGRRAADRRQGPRDRTDRRQPHACRSAITRRLNRGADIEGGMSAMPLWTSGAMAQAMRAQIAGALPEAITGLSIDSRTIAPGEAYFAIKGDVHDGHDFVAAALKAGAALAVVETAQRDKFAARCAAAGGRRCARRPRRTGAGIARATLTRR